MSAARSGSDDDSKADELEDALKFGTFDAGLKGILQRDFCPICINTKVPNDPAKQCYISCRLFYCCVTPVGMEETFMQLCASCNGRMKMQSGLHEAPKIAFSPALMLVHGGSRSNAWRQKFRPAHTRP